MSSMLFVVELSSRLLAVLSSMLFVVESSVVTDGMLMVGRLAGALTMVTVLSSGVLDDVLSSDEATTTAGVGAICGLKTGVDIAANAGTPNPTAAIPAVVQMIDFFTGVSFVLM